MFHKEPTVESSQFLEKYHYPLESHEVETEDGFILTLHRIPHGLNQSKVNGKPKPAVLLISGLACSSIDWIYQGPENSLALILADLGYDVWLSNKRGSRFSMNHKSLNSSDPAFWDYSWHEIGYYDLPASVDYIIDSTSVQKLTLIGHSEGTTTSMVMASTKPEYNEKINLMVLLSPIAYLDGVQSNIILWMVKYMDLLEFFMKAFKIYGIPYMSEINDLVINMCNDESPYQELCVNALMLLSGNDTAQINRTLLSVYVSNTPSGISVKELIHYGQEIISGYFRQYDYGEANVLYYGNMTPPSYDVSKISAPVASYYAKNDYFASLEDIEKLLVQLPNKADSYLVEYELFNHIDFIWAMDVKELVYDRVVSVIQKFNPLLND